MTQSSDNFLSAFELRMSDEERDALIQTLALFESGKLKTAKHAASGFPSSNPELFNFCCVWGQSECGTVACTLGWARFLVHDEKAKRIFPGGPRSDEQGSVFGMSVYAAGDPDEIELEKGRRKERRVQRNSEVGLCHTDVKVEHAALALRTFLETGTPDWKKAASAKEFCE